MKKKKNNTDKKYYVVTIKTPTLTPEVDNGKRNKDKTMQIGVMGIYKTLNTANKWARIYKNDIINIFDKAYKAQGWHKFENNDGTEDYVIKFKKSKELFEVNVFETKIDNAPPKWQYELNLYFDNELEDEEKIEDIEKYLREEAEEIKVFEEE